MPYRVDPYLNNIKLLENHGNGPKIANVASMNRAWFTSAFCTITLFACVGDAGFMVDDTNDPDTPDVVNCRPSDLIDLYKDIDQDGYGDPATGTRDCEIPEGFVSNKLDCNDSEPTAYEGATDLCGDKIDNDCNGTDVCMNSLSAHWNFAATTGTDATDFSGNLVNGILRNGLTHAPTPYLTFDGEDDLVEVPDSDLYQLSAGTVSLWFLPTTIGTQMGLVSKDSSGNDAGGHMGIYLDADGRVQARLQSNNETYSVYSETPVAPGVWHHIAFNFGGNEGMSLYVDNIAGGIDPYTGGTIRNREPLAIGVSTDNSGDLTVEPINKAFSGKIAEVQIYDRQLLSSEVTGLMMTSDPRMSGM